MGRVKEKVVHTFQQKKKLNTIFKSLTQNEKGLSNMETRRSKINKEELLGASLSRSDHFGFKERVKANSFKTTRIKIPSQSR